MVVDGAFGPRYFWCWPVVAGQRAHCPGWQSSVALLVLEWLALLLIWMLAWRAITQSPAPSMRHRLGNTFPSSSFSTIAIGVLALAPLWTGLLQLVPLPAELWAALPGRGIYTEGLNAIDAPAGIARPLSLTPDATWASLLAGIPLTATFLLAFTLPVRQLGWMVRSLIVLALFQAVMGILQLGRVGDLSFGIGLGGRAFGTFANPNHFASYIAMMVPLAILMLRQATARSDHSRRSARQRLPAGTLWGLALFLLLCGVLASGSRAGTVTCLMTAMLAVVALPVRSKQSVARRWALLASVALLVLVSVAVGLEVLMSRFADGQGHYLDNDRGLMLVTTWDAAMAFWPAGSGLGSFAGVYPLFQPPGVRGFAVYAHSDYVQLLMEGGLLFALLGALALWLVVRQAVQLVCGLRRSPSDQALLLQASCGLGLLAVFLHSWFDFNLRIPANAMLAAFLFGAYLRPACARSTRGTHHAPDTEPGMG